MARWQDAIGYVRRREGLGFAEACQQLGGSPSELGMARPPSPRRWSVPGHTSKPRPPAVPIVPAPAPLPELAEDLEPSTASRAAGMRFLEEAEGVLWSDIGERARAYLRGRGLKDETLRAWRIGFQPEKGRCDSAGRWGFPAPATASGQAAYIRIPRGIVLPWLLGGQLWQLKIRTNRRDPKYLAIAGGHPCLFGADTLVVGEPAILAEGEFDAMLLWQEVGDLVGVAALGSCRSYRRAAAELRY